MGLLYPEMRGIGMEALLIKTMLSLLIGGVLGIERGRKRRPAGLRTFMLVCFGSMVVMVTNQYASLIYKDADPLRLAAQVVSGIGFLGAGTILINSKKQISGITTAASLWTAACLGLAVGVGFYELALIGLVAAFLIASPFQYLDDWLVMRTKIIKLYIEYSNAYSMQNLTEYARINRYEIRDIEIRRSKILPDSTTVILLLKSMVKKSHPEMIQEWQKLEGIEHVEEIE